MDQRTSKVASTSIGHPAVTADALFALTDNAEHGEYADCQRDLESLLASVHLTIKGGAPLTETEKLLDEALWYLRAGDTDEAIYRLQQAEDAYDEAEYGDEDEDQE